MGPHCCCCWRDVSFHSALIERQRILPQYLKSGLIIVANVASDRLELNLLFSSSAKLKRKYFVKRDKTSARTLKNHFQLSIVCGLAVLP